MRLAPSPRSTDAALLVCLVVVLGTGVATLVAGTPSDAWVFVLHGVGGLLFLAPLYWKLRRVAPRVRAAGSNRVVALSVVLALGVFATLATGIAWSAGIAPSLGPWSVLVLHGVLGVLLVPLVLFHLRHRFRTPTTEDWEGRRSALRYAGLLALGGLLWRANRTVAAARGAEKRFTGSERTGGEGNHFPVTSWMLDDPDPVDIDDYRLRVVGTVDTPSAFTYDALTADADGSGDASRANEERAVLDCTSGWYAERDWRGVRVGDLLDATEVAADARWVTFHAVTGYRFGFPLAEARDLLLATHVDGDRLSHGHGFPLRLVAPGRRGYQWVKWVDTVEVRDRRDWGQWVAIFVSGLVTPRTGRESGPNTT